METTIIDRLRDFIEKKGSNLNEIKTRINLGHGTLNKAFKKNEGISTAYVEDILALWPETSEKEKYFIYTGKELKEPAPIEVREYAADPIVVVSTWMGQVDRDIAQIKRRLDLLEKG